MKEDGVPPATEFIVKMQRTKDENDSVTTWVHRSTRRVHFIPRTVIETSVNVANSFLGNIIKLNQLPDHIVLNQNSRFVSKLSRTVS